ncbi:hypothetical protein [Chryseolinea sp. H1M3-3]|uniref:hypothetical protein n=1 Tax=Chryseolinea sp. H1M3-3 TaxID=3034144 RepID=UPI0023ED871D|nr:hypothetical protein [Chryseolinea sp. H1M3-3]
MDLNTWDNFWKREEDSFHEVMKISTSFFAARLQKILKIKPGDELFDYGCGPGFLADDLELKQIRVTGADINNFFIEQSKKNTRQVCFY